MINLYENLKDDMGNRISGRAKLFVKKTNEDGDILECLNGTSFVPEGSGTMYVVDDWIIPQIDKLKCMDGQLVVKDGEMIKKPVKSEKEIKEEELLRQLAELRAVRNEPTQ